MKKIFLLLLLFVFASNCFAQFIPQFNRQPEVGYQINLSHPSAQGLVGRWLFHEGMGSRIYDLSPYGNDGTLTNMVPSDDWVIGRDGWALDFDGSDDHVNLGVADAIGFLTNNITIVAWVNKPSAGETEYIIQYARTEGGSGGFGFAVNTNIGLFCVTNGVQAYSTVGINLFALNTWTQVAVVFDSGNDASFYVNGVFIETVNGTNPIIVNSEGDDLLIGTSTGAGSSTLQNTFVGKISNIRYYSRTLSLQEIERLYYEEYEMFEQPPGRILAAAAPAPSGGEDKAIFNIIIGKNETKKNILERLAARNDSLYVSLQRPRAR